MAVDDRYGSKGEILAGSRCFPLFSQNRTFGGAMSATVNLHDLSDTPPWFFDYLVAIPARYSIRSAICLFEFPSFESSVLVTLPFQSVALVGSGGCLRFTRGLKGPGKSFAPFPLAVLGQFLALFIRGAVFLLFNVVVHVDIRAALDHVPGLFLRYP